MCKNTTEEFKISQDDAPVTSIVIAIHSHANFNDFWHRIPTGNRSVCTMLCTTNGYKSRTMDGVYRFGNC